MTTEPPPGSGGWCAPSDYHLYDLPTIPIELPPITAPRGGITFGFAELTPAEAAAAEALRARAQRVAEQMTTWRHEVISDAVAVAWENGWDVHLYEHPEHGWATHRDPGSYRITGRIGITFRPMRYAAPTIVEHRVDATWDEDEDWAEG